MDPGQPSCLQRWRGKRTNNCSQGALRKQHCPPLPPTPSCGSYLDDSIQVCSEILQTFQVCLPLPVTPPVSLCARREDNPCWSLLARDRPGEQGRGGRGETYSQRTSTLMGKPDIYTSQACSLPLSLVPAHTHAHTSNQTHALKLTPPHRNPTVRHKLKDISESPHIHQLHQSVHCIPPQCTHTLHCSSHTGAWMEGVCKCRMVHLPPLPMPRGLQATEAPLAHTLVCQASTPSHTRPSTLPPWCPGPGWST